MIHGKFLGQHDDKSQVSPELGKSQLTQHKTRSLNLEMLPHGSYIRHVAYLAHLPNQLEQ